MRKNIVIIVLLSIVAAVIGRGLSYPSSVNPGRNAGQLDGVHNDGWMESTVSIGFDDLASVGNRVNLYFNPWRPDNAGPAQIQPSLCGEGRGAILIDSPQPVAFSLKGNCEPRTIELRTLNPFQPASEDGRSLGAKLDRVVVTSPIGFPIVSLANIAVTAGAIIVLTALLFFCNSKWKPEQEIERGL